MLSFCMRCIYCDNPYTYLLGDKQRKCSKCKRKFSPQKVAKRNLLYKLFLEGHNARKVAEQTHMHEQTVLNYFTEFRYTMALENEHQYEANKTKIDAYNEYFYLPKSLKVEKNIEKLQHFLTLSYEGRVYNLMMPAIQKYHSQRETLPRKKLAQKYMRFNAVLKLNTQEDTITRFWGYFEKFILQYKGISHELFIYYLKEAEWRFNHLN